MEEKTVVLKSYEAMYDANFDLDILEQNGIPCFLSDVNVVKLYPMFNSPFGGIKLNVFDSDVERALLILNEIHSKDDTSD